MSNDWLPSRREDQTAMAENWLAVLASQGTVWNVPGSETAQLETLARAAEGILAKAKSAERTPVITAQCKEAFDGLSEKMRFIKSMSRPEIKLTEEGRDDERKRDLQRGV